MRRPVSRPTARPADTTRRTTGDTAAILVRVGDKVLGSVARLASGDSDMMTGSFIHRPAYADYADLFARLQKAIVSSRPDDDVRTEIEAAGVEVWHSAHEMRLDKAGTVDINAGEIRFRPTDAFLMMRTGGL